MYIDYTIINSNFNNKNIFLLKIRYNLNKNQDPISIFKKEDIMNNRICPNCNENKFKLSDNLEMYICHSCDHLCVYSNHEPDVSEFTLEKSSNNAPYSYAKHKEIIIVKDKFNKIKSQHIGEYLFVLEILQSLYGRPPYTESVICWLDQWLDLGLKISISDIETNFYKFPIINILKPDGNSFWSFDYNAKSITNLMEINNNQAIISLVQELSCLIH